MSLFEPFGVGSLYLPASGSIQHVEDRIVPNDLLADWQSLREKARAHPTVPEFLKRYERRGLAFSRAPDCFRRRIEASFHEGDNVMACEASYEGTPHFFLSQPFRRFLRASGLSVVRDYGASAWPVVNTQTTPYEMPRAASTPAPLVWSFWEDVPYHPGIGTDFVAPLADLVFYVDAFEAKLLGAVGAATPIREHFGTVKEEEPGWRDGLPWEIRGNPPLVASLPPLPGTEGWRIFPTREGFRRLRDRGLAVVRARGPGRDAPWEHLEVYWSPKEARS